MAVKDSAKAEANLRSVLERDPNRLDAYILLGQIYTEQRRLPDAIKQFEAIVQRDSKAIAARTMTGVLLEMNGQAAEAEKAYERTLADDPRAGVAANNLAVMLGDSNRDLNRALQLAQTARQVLPDNPNVADTLGWIYVKKNLSGQAIPYLEFSAKALPEEPVFHYHLGVAYQQTGNLKLARASLGRALNLNKEFAGAPDARRALAQIQPK
jgi:tetratricopeptide (TPR) repeat protein